MQRTDVAQWQVRDQSTILEMCSEIEGVDTRYQVEMSQQGPLRGISRARRVANARQLMRFWRIRGIRSRGAHSFDYDRKVNQREVRSKYLLTFSHRVELNLVLFGPCTRDSSRRVV
jgi:hypothetical protein